MAFFGSDGFDNQVRQLKHQLGQKGKLDVEPGLTPEIALTRYFAVRLDAQIATYMQELQKKDDLLAEHKRAKEDAVYKVGRGC